MRIMWPQTYLVAVKDVFRAAGQGHANAYHKFGSFNGIACTVGSAGQLNAKKVRKRDGTSRVTGVFQVSESDSRACCEQQPTPLRPLVRVDPSCSTNKKKGRSESCI